MNETLVFEHLFIFILFLADKLELDVVRQMHYILYRDMCVCIYMFCFVWFFSWINL